MIGPVDITMKQYEEYLGFITELTETNRVCWKVRLESGAAVLVTPVAVSYTHLTLPTKRIV